MQILIFWLWSLFGFTQPIEINCKCDYFELDHLGNIYVVDGSQLTKYDAIGNKLSNYSNFSLGNISSVDTSDPLRILLFYKDFNQILYLNNKLSAIGNEIDLYDFNNNETELACISQKGGFWLYNSIDNQAIHVTNSGNIAAQSILLGSFFDKSDLQKITEHNSKLYLLYSDEGILELDQNGQFLRKHILKGIIDFQVIGNQIFYQNTEGLYSLSSNNEKDILLFDKTKSNLEIIRLGKEKIYVSNKKSISIKSISF